MFKREKIIQIAVDEKKLYALTNMGRIYSAEKEVRGKKEWYIESNELEKFFK